jgi:hypothetical protein
MVSSASVMSCALPKLDIAEEVQHDRGIGLMACE